VGWGGERVRGIIKGRKKETTYSVDDLLVQAVLDNVVHLDIGS